MPPVVKVGDKEDLVDTSTFPLAKFHFDKFNPVQSRIFDYYDKDFNLVVASSTSSGKTCCAEIFLSHEIRINKRKGIYLVPYKALAQEKYNEWTDKKHHFGNLNVSVCTGDYRLTAERKDELDNANLIILSYEMFNSKVRNVNSERSQFLKDTGVLVVDECHSLNSQNRGHHLEAALMNFTDINEKCRLILLSATMPNVDEIADWASFILNHKNTVLISSKYRPCPLFMHYEKYYDGERNYYDNEQEKVNSALEIVEAYPDDKFLVFVHTKGTGQLMVQALKSAGIKCEFHNGDLDKAKRAKVEKEFKDGKELRVIVATSTLSAGINLPARRVIICGVHRGLDEVEVNDIAQECVSLNTNIMTADRTLFKKASEIIVGDRVQGVKNNLLTIGVVEKVIKSYGKLKHITFSNGSQISVANHPLLLWNGIYVNSDEVKVGDKVCITTKSGFANGIDLKELLSSKVAGIDNLYCKLYKIPQELPNNLHELLCLKRKKYIYKFKKNFICRAILAVSEGWDIQNLRSKNGSEWELNNVDYEGLAYLLGAIATDGNIKCNKTNTLFRIGIKNKDFFDTFVSIIKTCGLKCQLNQFPCNAPFSKDNEPFYEVVCSNYAFVKFLVAIGITPNKSKTLSMPDIISLKPKYKYAFLQGVIDGDGCVSKRSIRIATASEQFAKQLKDILLSLDIRSTIHEQVVEQKKACGKTYFSEMYCVTIGNIKDINCLVSKCNFSFKLKLIKFRSLEKETRPLKGDLFYTRVTKIENDDIESELINFTVSDCNTFITEDIVTHNCGRAGRPQFDPAGDAYVLLPEKTFDMHKERIKKPQMIQSQMLAQVGNHHKVLAFHLVSEIHQENIKNREDLHHWYKRSLACFQANDLNDYIIDNTLDLLKKYGAIWEEDGNLTVTSVGKIASLFYYSPFDVSDLKRNFEQLFNEHKQDDDTWLAIALANIDTHKIGIVSRNEREEMSLFANQVRTKYPGVVLDPCAKVAYVYNQLLHGVSNPVFASLTRTLQFDFPRLNQVLQSIDGFTGKWAKKDWFRELQLRISYGVKGPMVVLCSLPNIGKVRATKLWNAGIHSLLDVVVDPARVKKLTGLTSDKVDELVLEAKTLLAASV